MSVNTGTKKEAQLLVEDSEDYDLNLLDDSVVLLPEVELSSEDVQLSAKEDSNDAEVLLEIEDPESGETEEFIFELPFMPGAEDDDDSFLSLDEDELEEDVKVEELDQWDWHSGGLGKFIEWLHGMVSNIPKHTGKDTTGLEKAISYFEAIDKEITKAMRQDYRNEIDSAKAEEARAQIEDGLERLIDRLDKVRKSKFKRHNKKKSFVNESEIVKEGNKATKINGITVTVPLLISRVARVCINGAVSGGHNIQDIFRSQVKKYDLTKREQAECLQLLEDSGMYIRRDRGFLVDDDETFDPTSSDNYDFSANFYG